MKTYTPTCRFVTPPKNQGQMVTMSYALDAEAEVILVRAYDASDRTTGYLAYEYPENDGPWEPQNGSPDLGRLIGPCNVSQ